MSTTINVRNEPYGKLIDQIVRKPFWRAGVIAVRYKRQLYCLRGGIHTPFFITLALPILKGGPR